MFMSGCTVFVFFSLMEYALVNILMGDVVDGDEGALKKGIKSMFMATGNTGSLITNINSSGNRVPTAGQQVRLNDAYFILFATTHTLTGLCDLSFLALFLI